MFFFSSRRRHTRLQGDWSSDVCSSDLPPQQAPEAATDGRPPVSDTSLRVDVGLLDKLMTLVGELVLARNQIMQFGADRKSTRLNSSHLVISYAVFCLKKKTN